MKTMTHCAVLSLALLGTCYAQTTYPPATYPQPEQNPQQYQQFPQPAAPAHPMRALFAQSLAQVVQTGGSAAMIAVADGLTGALKSWFDSKRQRKGQNGALGTNYYPATQTPMTTSSYPQPGYPQSSYPQSNDPNAGAGNYPPTQYPAPATYPPTDGSVPGNTGYPDPNYPSTGYPSTGYPSTSAPDGSYPQPDAYPQNSGYPQNNSYPQTGAQTPFPTQPASKLYAGIAYEVHLLQPDGSTQPIDSASYAFRTGDQFRVYYRPSMPGRVDVFNVNAAGQNAQIDSSVVAAGDLASLGPYQFTDLQGEETLILKLSPCVTPQLYATTRSIVKVQGAQPVANPMGLGDCSNTATRGLKTKTRDIRKVAVEGGTSFALDAIDPNELNGNMSPRQVTITLHHR